MRNLFVTVVVALLLIAVVLPAQAGQVSPELQPIEEHNWGGDPDEDPAYEGWLHWWWYVMNVLYHYSCE